MLDAPLIRDIAGLRQRPAAGGLNLFDCSLNLLYSAAGGYDVRAGLSERPGKRETDAAGAADYDRGFIGEIEKSVAHQTFFQQSGLPKFNPALYGRVTEPTIKSESPPLSSFILIIFTLHATPVQALPL